MLPIWLENDVKPIDGYLFGSRSMVDRKSMNKDFDAKVKIGSKISHDTDYDIAAPSDMMIEKYLEQRNYQKVDPEGMYAKDKYFETLYTKKGHDGTNVQIILRTNHELFKRVWDSIDPWFYYENLWKRSPSVLKKTGHMDNIQRKENIMLVMNQLYKTAEKIYGI